ncbi:hypothetical protein BGW39_001341 [Mortierella sp. 14UC]|nr:hypothetical protein BGW39_001341 [Mortierella sp. 14UC]
MEPPSSDYMSVQDLSRPRKTLLQTQLEKIDPSIIKNGAPTIRNNRRGPGRPKIGSEAALFEVSVLAFREIILNRLWKIDKRFQNEGEFCKHQWDIPKPRKALLIECAEVLMELSAMPVRPCSEHVCKVLSQASVQLQPQHMYNSLNRHRIRYHIPRMYHKQHTHYIRQRHLSRNPRNQVSSI